jgi:methylated-DNA-[protein]-cysteine S-methyltransferase
MNEIYTVVDSPVGELLLGGVAGSPALRRLWFVDGGVAGVADPTWSRDDDAFAEVRAQLEEYFSGERQTFELELDLVGTEWERRVWSALLSIPYGETRSYGEIAAEVCTPAAARAVGTANARNPVAVIVPCHRVIGASGHLTGYGGGLERKRTLLDLEAGRLALSTSAP